MQIYFIRHAQSTNNLLWNETGSSAGRSDDPILTDLGQQQASLLANYLAQNRADGHSISYDPKNGYGYHFTHIYSSLMWRALATGATIAEALDAPLLGLKDIHETGGIFLEDPDTGELTGLAGKTPSELIRAFPRLVLPEGLNDDGWWNGPFESREARLPRAMRVLDWIKEKHGAREDKIALVSHGGFFNYLLWAVLGVIERPTAWFEINNASISRIDYRRGEFAVIYINQLDHLTPDLVS